MFKPGTRVKWTPDDDDTPDIAEARGTVRLPNQQELVYVSTWSASAQAGITDHVIVAWDGDEPWNGSWIHPEDIVAVEDDL